MHRFHCSICVVLVSMLGVAHAEKPVAKWIDLPLQDSKIWEPCNFGGDGEIEFTAKQAVLEMGDPMTGIRLRRPMPTDNYEIELEANRLDGFDFFVGLTFPVGDSNASLILGGWFGTVLGLSNIDGSDASDNPTTRECDFENERWYKVRLRVAPAKIQAWVDDRLRVDQPRAGVKFDIRGEMDPSTPFGIATYGCKVAYRKIRYRELGPSAKTKP